MEGLLSIILLLPNEFNMSINTIFSLSYGPQLAKNLGFANNTGADQPAHPCRLISAFVIRFLESNISKLATDEVPIF